VVDDDVFIVELFRMALQAEDYDVETVFTGEQALDAMKGTKFDLVIIDIMLPDIRGDRVVEKNKGEKRRDSRNVINGSSFIRQVYRCFEAGDFRDIVKTN